MLERRGYHTLQTCFQRVIDTINAGPAPVLLVGHSMGGVPISGAAEAIPDKIGRLVLPENGLKLGEVDLGPDSAQRAVIARDEHSVQFDPALTQEVFFHLCPPQMALRAARRVGPQPIGAFSIRISLSAERWGQIPKTYIICTQDRAFPPALQYQICARMPLMERRFLETDHSPLYSDAEGLGEILDAEARGDS